MLSTVKKDKLRRHLVKKFQIKKLFAKVFQQDLLLKEALEKKCATTSLSPFLYQKATKTIPRNSSKIRVKNRCVKSGRSRGILKFCKLSRIVFREQASKGAIPGISKASW